MGKRWIIRNIFIKNHRIGGDFNLLNTNVLSDQKVVAYVPSMTHVNFGGSIGFNNFSRPSDGAGSSLNLFATGVDVGQSGLGISLSENIDFTDESTKFRFTNGDVREYIKEIRDETGVDIRNGLRNGKYELTLALPIFRLPGYGYGASYISGNINYAEQIRIDQNRKFEASFQEIVDNQYDPARFMNDPYLWVMP